MTASYLQRFAGVGRLYGRAGLERLAAAHVAVVGLGGVGSWAAEALARTGVGALTLVDMDDVCVSNTNRQIQALAPEIGRPKAVVLRERVLAINPECRATAVQRFFTRSTAAEILSPEAPLCAVADAIDSLSDKCLLVAECRRLGIGVASSGGCAGKRDATAVRVSDMSVTTSDNLLRFVRKKLRHDHGFPRGGKRPQKFDVPCVWSEELSTGEPQACDANADAAGNANANNAADASSDTNTADANAAAAAAAPLPGAIAEGESLRPNCEWGYGTAVFVSGVFGFALAGVIAGKIATGEWMQKSA
ncbi:MAG: tRNA threonylcarbamoyladenosine dehydratase [Puniceicoccales bacterium]|jgi:tRNA A37 threonylcarbamoyladenosine dehydratase|nr:tRNA threonylcarbamoyladenosine dehydratase [Puniceicoccales bacterium]